MKEYHKIEALFKREEGGKHRVIEGEFRNPTVEQCKDLEWIFTEKVDGTNIRVYWDGHKVEFNGRTDNAQLHKDLVLYIQEKLCTHEVEQIFEQRFGEKEVYIFGEGFGAGIQKGGEYGADKRLIIFDIQVNGIYLSYDDVVDIANIFELPVVEILARGTIQDGISFVKNTEYSRIGTGKQPLEGVVGRLKEEMYDKFGNRMIVKIKSKDLVRTEQVE